MNESEIGAKLVVLEVMLMTTLGVVFALTGQSDPGHAKALAVLNSIKTNVVMRLNETGDSSLVRVGEDYLDLLLSELSGGLGSLRPGGS
jgi:hypothetical protein